MHSRAFDVIYPFNILYHEGLLPELIFFPYRHEVRYGTGYLKEYYRRYFAIFGKEDAETASRIERYIDSHAADNRLADIQKGTLGVILWRSP